MSSTMDISINTMLLDTCKEKLNINHSNPLSFMILIWFVFVTGLVYSIFISAGDGVQQVAHSKTVKYSRHEVDRLLVSNKQNLKHDICNLEFLRDYFIQHGHPFQDGSWEGKNWIPNSCMIPASSHNLGTTLQEVGLRKLTIIGDSTASKLKSAFLNLIKQNGVCKVLKTENMTNHYPDKTYYGLKNLIVNARQCSSCVSELSLCKLNSSHHSLFIEYLAMENYLNSHLSILRYKRHYPGSGLCGQDLQQFKDWGVYCPESATSQQVLFNEYLPLQRIQPDVIILVASQHEVARRDARASSRALAWLLDLIDHSVSNNTRVLFLEQTTGRTKLNPAYYKDWTSDLKMELIREDSYKVLSSALEYSKVLYPFYGLASISRDVISWNVDGVHYNGDFYRAVAHLIIGAL